MGIFVSESVKPYITRLIAESPTAREMLETLRGDVRHSYDFGTSSDRRLENSGCGKTALQRPLDQSFVQIIKQKWTGAKKTR